MKICVAQTRPVKGDVPSNIQHHLTLIEVAIHEKADLIVFPELSLTGYEPELAEALATTPEDVRFDVFQELSDTHQLSIGVGMPLRDTEGITISMVVFQPRKPREVYHKYYLHEDEEPYFVSKSCTINSLGQEQKVALAICYEISIPAHAEKAVESKANYYLASVAKTVSGVEKASVRLSEIATTYAMPVLMANCIGPCEGQPGGGKTGAWNKQGELIAALDAESEGIVIFDTSTEQCFQQTI